MKPELVDHVEHEFVEARQLYDRAKKVVDDARARGEQDDPRFAEALEALAEATRVLDLSREQMGVLHS